MPPKASGQPARACLRSSDTESSILMYDDWGGPKASLQTPPVVGTIYWSLFYLAFVGIWAYQALLSAQAYYTLHFPEARLEFWGVVAGGFALLGTHLVHVAFDIDANVGYDVRVVPALAGFAVVAALVMVWRSAASVLLAFALVGVCQSVSQSPLFGLAGLFETGSFTQALSAGNGLAGVLAVLVEAAIRAAVSATTLSREGAHLVSFLIFMGLLVVLAGTAVVVYLRLSRMSAVQQALVDAATAARAAPTVPLVVLARAVWLPMATIFLALFVTLAVWPGLPCSAAPTGFFSGHPEWFCAPAVIAAYNVADLLGRSLAGHPALAAVPLTAYLGLAVARLLYIPVLVYLTGSWGILVAVFLVGITNGLAVTVPLMQGPLVFPAAGDRRTAASLLTAAMFAGIAFGAIVPALLHSR